LYSVSEEWGHVSYHNPETVPPATQPTDSRYNLATNVATTVLMVRNIKYSYEIRKQLSSISSQTMLFFVFWTPLLSLFDIAPTTFRVERILLSVDASSMISNVMGRLMQFCIAMLGYFSYILVVYIISVLQIRYMEKDSLEFTQFVASVREATGIRMRVGPNKAFRQVRKLLRVANREVPQAASLLLFSIAQQLIRLFMLKLGIGVLIERFVAKFRGLDKESVHASMYFFFF